MMVELPTILYKTPGRHQCLGGTFDYRGVSTKEKLDQALAEGWKLTLPEAMGGGGPVIESTPVAVVVEEVISSAPPTREELEIKAKELGIGFNKNTKDEVLLEKITQALEDGE